MRITFFVPTVIGYLAWPPAIYARGLAAALASAGHEVRVLEERRNRYFTETLREAGQEPARRFHLDFPSVQYHTYEARHGTLLLEWVTRELALVDAGIAVGEIDPELKDMIANTDRPGLTKVFLDVATSSDEGEPVRPVPAGFDLALSLPRIVAAVDEPLIAGLPRLFPAGEKHIAPADAAHAFERALSRVRDAR